MPPPYQLTGFVYLTTDSQVNLHSSTSLVPVTPVPPPHHQFHQLFATILLPPSPVHRYHTTAITPSSSLPYHRRHHQSISSHPLCRHSYQINPSVNLSLVRHQLFTNSFPRRHTATVAPPHHCCIAQPFGFINTGSRMCPSTCFELLIAFYKHSSILLSANPMLACVSSNSETFKCPLLNHFVSQPGVAICLSSSEVH